MAHNYKSDAVGKVLKQAPVYYCSLFHLWHSELIFCCPAPPERNSLPVVHHHLPSVKLSLSTEHIEVIRLLIMMTSYTKIANVLMSVDGNFQLRDAERRSMINSGGIKIEQRK